MIKFYKIAALLVLSVQLQANVPSFSVVNFHHAFLQSDDACVLVGSGTNSSKQKQLWLARYTNSGFFDTSFNTTGIATLLEGESTSGESAVLQADNKIIVAGSAQLSGTYSLFLARYTDSGALDSSFGANGITTQSYGDGVHGADIALQSSGKSIVAGTTIIDGQAHAIVFRFNTDGTLDASFGSSGFIILSPGFRTEVKALCIDDVDRVIIVGQAFVGGIHQFFIARITESGSIDAIFGSNGITVTELGDIAYADDIIVQSDGKYIALGASDSQIAVVRYTASGIVDTTFGVNGIGIYPIGVSSQARSGALQSDGKILVVGLSDQNFVTLRLNSDGTFDNTFGTNGTTLTSLATYDEAISVCIQSDEKIVVVGQSDYDCGALRYTTHGILDHSFGYEGIILQPAGTRFETNRISYLSDEKNPGTNGGTFFSGSWQTRTLNTFVGNRGNVALSNNQFTLQPGTYDISASCPAFRVGYHQIRLFNVTKNKVEKVGSNELAGASFFSSSMSYSNLDIRVALSEVTTFEIQHYCQSTNSGDGFGVATGFNLQEVYSQVKITKL